MNNLLSLITFVPAIAAAILALFLRGNDPAAQRNAKWLALFATVVSFALSLLLLKGFDPANTGFQFVEDRPFNDQRYYISNTKLKALGWKITTNFEQGINDLIERINELKENK